MELTKEEEIIILQRRLDVLKKEVEENKFNELRKKWNKGDQDELCPSCGVESEEWMMSRICPHCKHEETDPQFD